MEAGVGASMRVMRKDGLVTTSAVDRPPDSLPGQGRTGIVLLIASIAGLPLLLLIARRLGRRGVLLVEAVCAVLFARDVSMTAAGAPAQLKLLPRMLLLVETASSGVATLAGLYTFARWPRIKDRGENRTKALATVATTTTFLLHAAREAIYLSPGHGMRGGSHRSA